jgi:hypothetical protein
LADALYVLNHSELQEYLRAWNIVFDPEARTLQAVLRAHPQTRLLFEPLMAPPGRQGEFDLLNSLGLLRQIPDIPDVLASFAVAQKFAQEIARLKEIQLGDLETMHMRVRDSQPLTNGDLSNLYVYLHRLHHSIFTFWDDLGFGAEFNKLFNKQEAKFWDSSLSLVDIHSRLTAMRSQGTSGSPAWLSTLKFLWTRGARTRHAGTPANRVVETGA